MTATEDEQIAASVDFCVTTFKRPSAVERLILSIGDRYPCASVYVGDQNRTLDRSFYNELASRSGLRGALHVESLDFDCGVSVARNQLVTSTKRSYKLMLDDDFLFTEATDIAPLLKLLDLQSGAAVAAGAVASNGQIHGLRSHLRSEGDTLLTVADSSPYRRLEGIRYSEVDFVSNFSLIRDRLFEHVLWDPDLKIFEHRDFFLRVKATPYKVLFSPDAVIGHQCLTLSPEYALYRYRFNYRKQMLRKHGFTQMR